MFHWLNFIYFDGQFLVYFYHQKTGKISKNKKVKNIRLEIYPAFEFEKFHIKIIP